MSIISDALRNSQLDDLVSNLDALEIKDSGGTVIAEKTSGIGWNAASSGTQGEVTVSGTPTLTGTSAAGSGTNAVSARAYHSGASGEEVDGLNVGYRPPNPTTWATGQSISQGDVRINDGIIYEATEAHTTDADTEPGFGSAWPDVWKQYHVTLDNLSIADLQSVDVNSATLTYPAAVQGN